MSDIQFALTILAVIIILIMIIFNWIRLVQYRKQNHAEKSFLYKDENGLSLEEKNPYDHDLSISEKYLLSNLPKDIYRDIDAIAFIRLNKATHATSKLNLRDFIELPHAHCFIRRNEDIMAVYRGLNWLSIIRSNTYSYSVGRSPRPNFTSTHSDISNALREN